MVRRRAALPGLALLVLANPAVAGELDFRLNATDANDAGILFDCGANGCAANNAAFRDFTTQLGFVFSPRLAAPSETLGHSGFHVGAMWSGTLVSEEQRYWQVTEAQRSMLQTLQLDIRKGLPFSFEVGANFMWLAESELFAPGLDVGWALNEGFAYVPDISVRAGVNHVVGNRDLLMTTVSTAIGLSKSFGVGGTVNLTPYTSWTLVMIAATSRVIDPTPTVEEDLTNNLVFAERTATSDIGHKLTVGLRLLAYILNVSVQGEFQMLPSYETGGSSIVTITTKLGLDY